MAGRGWWVTSAWTKGWGDSIVMKQATHAQKQENTHTYTHTWCRELQKPHAINTSHSHYLSRQDSVNHQWHTWYARQVCVYLRAGAAVIGADWWCCAMECNAVKWWCKQRWLLRCRGTVEYQRFWVSVMVAGAMRKFLVNQQRSGSLAQDGWFQPLFLVKITAEYRLTLSWARLPPPLIKNRLL